MAPPADSSQASTGLGTQVQITQLAASHASTSSCERVHLSKDGLKALQDELASETTHLHAVQAESPAIRTAIEWMLDNHYIVLRAIAQLGRDLPPGFQRGLPWLIKEARPRVIAVAETIWSACEGRDLDPEHIEHFLHEYQATSALTIGELWALPPSLRLTILQHLAHVLRQARIDPAAAGDVGSATGRAIRSLHLLAEIDYEELFCRVSLTERLLLEDPMRAYGNMDSATRDVYRREVEDLSRTSGQDEREVCRAALSGAATAEAGSRKSHVGYWLLDDGRAELEAALGVRSRSWERRVLSAPRTWFFGLLLLSQITLLAPVLGYLISLQTSWPTIAAALLLTWFPASVPAATFVQWILSRLVRPRRLLKLDFSAGIPAEFRTLVAIPTLLGETLEIDELLGRLEVHFLANPDPQLTFALVTDHVDTDDEPGDVQERRLNHAIEKVRKLNERYAGTGRSPFHLLHRASRFNPVEGRWMGWERKRGKLEELNRFLRHAPGVEFETHEGDPEGLSHIAFVLTLDSDTQLPPNAAPRLVGTLAHPLNRPVIEGGRVAFGYTVIQPRVEISPRSSRLSAFTRLFSGDIGIDIYTRAVSETYQDLFGEGIFVGKGIYDVDGFLETLEGRVPDNSILSHDLFEGVHGRTALATDVLVYEDYPPNYLAYIKRLHRWVRGDWQLVPWLLVSVPLARGGRGKNQLSMVDRFKVLDNLRRSLLAPAMLILLTAGWFWLPGHPLFWTGAAVLAPGAATVWTLVRTGRLPHQEVGRWFLAVCFAPQESHVALDAIGRVLYRLFWSRKRLLEWTPADQVARLSTPNGASNYWRLLWVGPLVSVSLGCALFFLQRAAFFWALPWLALWFFSPLVAWRISRATPFDPESLDAHSMRHVRHIARRTWLFFENFVGPRDRWLPPDHFQEAPRGAAAHRTSPTNIGLLLLSELAAHDLGYLTPNELASWVKNTLDTMDQLETHRGHLLNWYDTQSLAPLDPRYVSTVDSGNLAGALLTLAVGLGHLAENPVASSSTTSGLRDAFELLEEALLHWEKSSADVKPTAALKNCAAAVVLLDGSQDIHPALVDSVWRHFDMLEADILEGMHEPAILNDMALLTELRMWLDRLRHQLDELRREVRRNDKERAEIGSRLAQLAQRARAHAQRMDFSFLYDKRRNLFHVGYNVSADRLDQHHYDLLASEARLASFLTVMSHQVPMEHWFSLGRPVANTGRQGQVLLSWGGSMFEYLMPALLMRSHPDTLLHQSCRAAVDVQIEWGKLQKTPWGVSESSFFFLDGQQTYQYRAFGVPGLGLRRGLEEDAVVAPYASLLALPIRPAAAMENLRRLEQLGAFGQFGFYDAVDFDPKRAPGGHPQIVRSYMAHHQGMGLLAIDNFLSQDVMVRRFHGSPGVESWALLLDEKIPEGAIPPRAEESLDEPTNEERQEMPHLPQWQPDARPAQAWALGNGNLTSIVTLSGNRGLRHGELMMTRWELDPTSERHGSRVYIRDQEDGSIFGACPRGPSEGDVTFHASQVSSIQRFDDWTCRVRVTVAPDSDVEINEVELRNLGERPRYFKVVDCLEPVLEPEREFGRHPAFSKLFLHCQPLKDGTGVVVSRRHRERRKTPVLVYRVVAPGSTESGLVCVDRREFWGRGPSTYPAAVARGELGGATEPTVDPLCALAAVIELPPRTSQTVVFLTAVANSKRRVMELAERFSSPHAVRWAFEGAERSSARRAHELGILPQLLPTAQRLLGGLFYPTKHLRAPESVLSVARPSQPLLWGRGISGDEPIVIVRTYGDESEEFLGELLSVHRYFRFLGIRFDILIIDTLPSGYDEVISNFVERSIKRLNSSELLHQRGGIHVVRSDQVPDQEMNNLMASAAIYFDARQGTLTDRLEHYPHQAPHLPSFQPSGAPPASVPGPPRDLPIPDLEDHNGLGGFDGNEYIILPRAVTPAPWCNVLANERFGCLVSESSLGSTWSENAGENRLTPWHNDPVLDPPSEALYLRDEETAGLWSVTSRPIGEPTLVRHGFGYSSFRSIRAGIDQTTTVFVPPNESVKVVRLRVVNLTQRSRRLTATYYAEWVLGAGRRETRAYIVPTVSTADSCLLARNSWSMDFAGRVAYLATDSHLHGFTTDRVEMMGPGGDLTRPAALGRWGLSGTVAPGLDPCAAIQVHVDLDAGQSTEVHFFLGQEEDEASARSTVKRLRQPGALSQAWRATKDYWEDTLGSVRIRTPDARLDRLSNGWLLYQTIVSRFFGRTAFYQSSGAFGFRDQLQDCLAFLHTDPSLTRQQILLAARHQFTEGDVLHWWHPPSSAGVRTRCSDDLLWLVYVTAEYVHATGDADILQERVPFLTGPSLEEHEHVRYARFAVGPDETLLEHCRRAWSKGFTCGSHGLPLIGDGDWNDGMDKVGAAGKGESVWLGWFVYACTERLAQLLDRAGQQTEAEHCRQRLPALAASLSEHGWDGKWFRRAYFDDGSPVGSAEGHAPHIDSIAQSWAALSGAGEPEKVRAGLAAVQDSLVLDQERMVLLLAPPFRPGGPDPGYIAAYPPGIRENGGQYTHAAAWLGWAHIAMLDGDEAYRVASLLNPLERATGSAEVEKYRVEPYVLAGDIYGREPFMGRGGWTWYTGAAAWTWRLVIEGILGLRRVDGCLEVVPCLPSHFDGFEAWIKWASCEVHVIVRRTDGPDSARVVIDGHRAPRARVDLSRAGTRTVEIWLDLPAGSRTLQAQNF